MILKKGKNRRYLLVDYKIEIAETVFQDILNSNQEVKNIKTEKVDLRTINKTIDNNK